MVDESGARGGEWHDARHSRKRRWFGLLLDYLQRTRGFDFTAYKRSSLRRRILKRMQTVGIATIADYNDYLEVHAEEFEPLFNTILINVTSFFRDAPVWDYVWHQAMPMIQAQKRNDEPVRMWSAGCSSGEEAYSLAIVAAEVFGSEGFRNNVKIYATDIDNEALNQARQANYGPRQLREMPPELLGKYFEPQNGRYVFNKDLRRAVIFGRHDLLQDAPISHVDLLVCRNTLMYFNAEAQAKILNRFAFATRNNGLLLLGKGLKCCSTAVTPLPHWICHGASSFMRAKAVIGHCREMRRCWKIFLRFTIFQPALRIVARTRCRPADYHGRGQPIGLGE